MLTSVSSPKVPVTSPGAEGKPAAPQPAPVAAPSSGKAQDPSKTAATTAAEPPPAELKNPAPSSSGGAGSPGRFRVGDRGANRRTSWIGPEAPKEAREAAKDLAPNFVPSTPVYDFDPNGKKPGHDTISVVPISKIEAQRPKVGTTEAPLDPKRVISAMEGMLNVEGRLLKLTEQVIDVKRQLDAYPGKANLQQVIDLVDKLALKLSSNPRDAEARDLAGQIQNAFEKASSKEPISPALDALDEHITTATEAVMGARVPPIAVTWGPPHRIVDGFHRLAAAQLLGFTQVPVCHAAPKEKPQVPVRDAAPEKKSGSGAYVPPHLRKSPHGGPSGSSST